MQKTMGRLLNLVLIVLTLFTTATPTLGHAGLPSSETVQRLSQAHSGLYAKIPDRQTFKVLEPKIRALAIQLIEENSDALKRLWRLEGPIDADSLKISLLHLVPNSNYVEVSISQPRSLDYTNIRTNGEFAFLGSSYMYRENNKTYTYKAVGFVNGKIESFSQTELIISTLPEVITLSRVMGEEERHQWIQGIPYRSKTFGAKVHFGANYFKFNEQEPYIMQIRKGDLLDFLENNQLEINTYDPMFENEMKLTDLGLEFEYVIIGEEAITKLMPLIQSQL